VSVISIITGFVKGKEQFSTPYRNDTPQPIANKFVTGNYVGNPYSCAKLVHIRPQGASGQMGEV